MYKFLLFLSLGFTLNAQMVGGVSIIVKDQAITIYEIKEEMRISGLDADKAAKALIRQKLEAIEIKERKINVSSTEVYDDIKETAKRNGLSVNEFYERALNSNGINSKDLKAKVKQKLLSQKLYSSIAYSKLKPPSDAELEEYYKLNTDTFSHPKSFTVTIYQTTHKEALAQKIANPMFYSPQVQEVEQVLPYRRIDPNLAQLLTNTPLYNFTQIIPDGKGGYMSLYLKEREESEASDFETVKSQVQNLMLAQKREKVLGDHFKRLRENADIKILRNPS